MKQKISGWSERYGMAMRRYLKQGHGASLRPAVVLGREALSLGLETLVLARIHDQSLSAMVLTGSRNAHVKLATLFFDGALGPIAETSSAARESKLQLKRLEVELNSRTVELAASNHQLELGVVRHRAMATALEKSGKIHRKCLEGSLHFQKRLRQLTRRVLAAQEDERRSISEELQKEIAQTLLGINVRLLSLKEEARSSARGLKKEIATTHRMVTKSVKSVQQVVRRAGSL